MSRRAERENIRSRTGLDAFRLKRPAVVLSAVFLIMTHNSKSLATPQLDQMGLLPPITVDQSLWVDQIRKALGSHDFQSMKKDVDELLRSDSRSWEGYFWEGFLDLQLRNGDDAVRALRHAEALDANSSVLKLLAVTYYTLRQYRLFILMMNRAIQKNPNDFAPYYYLGRYYVSADMSAFGTAANYFQKALQLNPRHPLSAYYFGYCYEVQRKLVDAEREYRRSMELAKDSRDNLALPYQGMARLRLLESKPSNALRYAKKAVKLAPNDASSHTLLAKVYGALGQQADAVREWVLVTELDQTDAVSYYRLFQIYSALGMKEQANKALANFKKLTAIYGSP